MRYVKLELSELDAKRRIDRKDNPGLAGAVCGDKELVVMCLSNSPKLKGGQDLSKFARIDRDLSELKDPCYWAIEEADWTWLKGVLDHEGYGLTMKDDKGNAVPAYPAPLKKVIGIFLEKFLEAANKMPEDLKEKVLKEEAKTTKKKKSA